nr:hypothetical protein [Micromonospora purpureochromogenes]
MLTVTVYHNADGRFAPYQDGHQLIAATSHRLPAGADWDPHGVADWAYHAFNADLDHLETGRDTIHGEITFLAACVYRLLGYRSLSVGDVIHVQEGEDSHWLACEPVGWRRVNAPSNVGGAPLAAEKAYKHIRSQRTKPVPELFTQQQVADALNRAADEILDAVNAGDEGLRDALNLMVNATGDYLAGKANTLREVVENGYHDDYETVLSWIETAV